VDLQIFRLEGLLDDGLPWRLIERMNQVWKKPRIAGLFDFSV
jgi:hypothetical protein